ncbi:MAG: preprotein translocase subunit YajC [Planctomycetes bacterium]|nr:preprotein translocase subunit YajC [Planctomycetota bacterium]
MTALLAHAMVFAEAATSAGAGAGAPVETPSLMAGLAPFIPILVIFMLFIWFTSRSQKKRQQARQQMLDGLQPKDDVVTIGGIKGRIVTIKDDEVVLRIDKEKDVKITISKSGIGNKVGEQEL